MRTVGVIGTKNRKTMNKENKDLRNAENTELKMMVPAPMSIRIFDPVTNELLGEFKEKEGLLTFEGKVDEAGKMFVDFVCETFKQRIEHWHSY